MAWTTPGTATAGSVLTAAFWNEQVRDNFAATRAAQINVQSSNTSTKSSTTSATYATISGLSAAITPSSASSKVLVLATLTIGCSARSGSFAFQILRGATAVGNSDDGAMAWYVADIETADANMTFGERHLSLSYLDSPATASSTTYAIQWKRTSGSGTGYINRRSFDETFDATSTVTLIEVPV